MGRMVMKLRLAGAGVFAVAALLAASSPAGAAPIGTYTTVVAGLDNPRDLDFSPNGQLYVAEAGHGGSPSDCVGGGEGGGSICPGFTSGISLVDIAAGTAHRV